MIFKKILKIFDKKPFVKYCVWCKVNPLKKGDINNECQVCKDKYCGPGW